MTPYYEDSAVTLYCGDCREILPDIGTVDHVITDPPYDLITHEGARTSKGGTIHRQPIDFAPIGADLWFVPILLDVSRRWVIAFCALEQLAHYQSTAGLNRYIRSAIWRRHSGPQFSGDRPAQSAEGIAIMHRSGKKVWNGGGDAACFDHLVERTDRVHPTQKPELLMRELVTLFSDPGEIVLDIFAGSGTTLVAAKRLGRKAIGIELDEKYCEVAAKRLAQGALDLWGDHVAASL